MCNIFLAMYNSGIAAKTASIIEILLTLVKRVQPRYFCVRVLNKLKLNRSDFVDSIVQVGNAKKIHKNQIRTILVIVSKVHVEYTVI